jgi:arginine deiminase
VICPAAVISEFEARTVWADHPGHQGQQRARLGRIEDYLLINGDYLSAAEAAARLGVSARTVVRYRAALRALREAA